MKKNSIFVVIGVIVSILLIFSLASFMMQRQQLITEQLATPTVRVSPVTEAITYEGREGIDALTLLKENREVEQNATGLVTAINGRKAQDAKKEFWAFYVNGIYAQVGPAEYITKKGDRIEWKIETY